MNFTTQECAWKDIRVTLLGSTLTGISGFEMKVAREKEFLYGAGDEPIDIQSGNKERTGNFKLNKYEVDKLNDAALAAGYEDVTDIPHELVTAVIKFKKSATSPTRTITITGIAFQELAYAQEQGAKKSEMTLPFMAMGAVIR